MPLRIPQPLKEEHAELHAELVRATKAGGRTGEAALLLVRIMRPHFEKEEEYALPPLGLLVELSREGIAPGMSEVLQMTDRLATELPRMLAEHKQIVAALNMLIDAARAEGKPEFIDFAQKLMAHARAEEEISYPTALLIGRYVRAASNPAGS
jgi:hypothetical protein